MKKIIGLIAILTLVIQPLAQGQIDEYVSNPSNIPDFHNFNTPQLEPGENGDFSLDILNRYKENMTNATIIAEIYHRADIDESEEINEILAKERPYITTMNWKSDSSNEIFTSTPSNTMSASFLIGEIKTNETISLEFKINSNKETKEGTYFVRFSIDFEHNNSLKRMESRGHWNMEVWEIATTNNTENYPGNINLDILEVDGIIPDSSFGIKKPIPKWPLYLLISLTVIFAGLSVIFYLEEEGNYPQLNKWLQKQRGKFNQFRLRFKYRKGS